MTDLSPAAKAAINAYHAAPIVGVYPKDADAIGVVAALRALANYLHQPGSGINHWWPDEHMRREPRNIADELDP